MPVVVQTKKASDTSHIVFPFAYAPRRSVQAGGIAALLAGLVLLVS